MNMNGIARAGLVPGVDVSVTGYDDLPLPGGTPDFTESFGD